MLAEIEKERKTKRKHKKCGEARTASRVAEFAPSSIFSLSLSLSCRFYSRSFSLSAPLPRIGGLVGRSVLSAAARCQDAPGGLVRGVRAPPLSDRTSVTSVTCRGEHAHPPTSQTYDTTTCYYLSTVSFYYSKLLFTFNLFNSLK